MLLESKGKYFRIDDLSRQTGLVSRDDGLGCYQLSALLNFHGLNAIVQNRDTDTLQNDLNTGLPSIALIRYADIPNRQSSYSGGHFVIVVGYDQDNFYINDPDWYGSRRDGGFQFKVPKVAFQKAIANSPVPYQCVIVKGYQNAS